VSERAQPLPQVVSAYLLPLVLRSRHPAFLRTDAEGLIVEQGGALAHYGFSAAQVGLPASAQIGLLAGLLPHVGEPLHLAAVHTESGACADLHIFSDGDDTWVVLLDTRSEHDQKQAMQQKGNELSLRSERQGLVLDAYLGKSVAAELLAGRWRRSAERREVTVLFADIRGFTPYSEISSPEEVFQTLNQYLPTMIEPIEARGGLIEQIAGDAVMAIFGLGEVEPGMACQQAIAAGLDVQRAVHALYGKRAAQAQTCLGVGIGIATGPAAVGIIGTQDRRGFAAIGHHVNLASRLQGQAQAFEVVIDEPTHAQWLRARTEFERAFGWAAVAFEERQVALKGFREQLRVFVATESQLRLAEREKRS
jgi:class 3 adenylate cyclase